MHTYIYNFESQEAGRQVQLRPPALLLQLLRLASEQGNALTLRPSRPTSVGVFQKSSPKNAPYKVFVDEVECNGTEAKIQA